MDSLSYSYSSESSSPRTPSPQEVTFSNSPSHYKANIDIEPPRLNIFTEGLQDDNASVYTPDGTQWNAMSGTAPFYNTARSSLLQELYEHEIPTQAQDIYLDNGASSSPESLYSAGTDNWSNDIQRHQEQQHQQQQQQQQHHHQHQRQDYHLMRRATFPSVRKDYGESITLHHPHQPQQYGPQSAYPHYNRGQQDALFVDMPLSANPSSINGDYYHDDHPHHHQSIKLEDNPIPSQQNFYRPQHHQHHAPPPLSMSYLSPHTGLPVQHTDDAASKETQYLRRRCHNCHTTEPPSWRRSTLNPGKIVCNKCGLYERTHLRPRPLRFDELRAGNKARKQNTKNGAVSPKAAKLSPTVPHGGAAVKKESRDFGVARRASVSSGASSVQSGGNSDWDDNVSLYSSGSASTTSYSSPNMSPFLVPSLPNSASSSRSHSHSPPLEIRLPGAPLSEIASLGQPRRQNTSPTPYSASQEHFRRGSMPEMQSQSNGWNGGSPLTGKSPSPLQMQVHLEPSPQMQPRGSPLMASVAASS